MENNKVQNLIDLFDDKIENNPECTQEDCQPIIGQVNSPDELKEGMKLLKERAQVYSEKITNCDANIKQWQDSKKMWVARNKAFIDTLEKLMLKLNVPKNVIKADGIKLAISTRTSLEVDENWLLAQYEKLAEALQLQLPDYVKVSLSIDKNKLFAHVKQDGTMLVNNPDKIHTKESRSTTIK